MHNMEWKTINNGLLVNADEIEETIWNVFNEEENEQSDDNQIETKERFECGVESECISSKKCISCCKMEGSIGRKQYKRFRQYTEEEDMQMALLYMEEAG